MGAPKATPGPWVESGSSDWFPDRYEALSDAVWTVLRSEGADIDVAIVMEAASVYGGTPTLDANAYQIAASGELYDALEALVASAGPVNSDGWHNDPIHSGEITKARAALARARGEQPA